LKTKRNLSNRLRRRKKGFFVSVEKEEKFTKELQKMAKTNELQLDVKNIEDMRKNI